LAKTLTFRTVAIALLAALTFYFTGNAGEATTITILFNACGAAAYYVLERLWNSISWGIEQKEPGRPGRDTLPPSPSLRSSKEVDMGTSVLLLKTQTKKLPYEK